MRRVLDSEQIEMLIGVLEDTDDGIETGLSQMGLDPDEFSQQELNRIEEQLAEDEGFVQADPSGFWEYQDGDTE